MPRVSTQIPAAADEYINALRRVVCRTLDELRAAIEEAGGHNVCESVGWQGWQGHWTVLR